MKFCASTIVAVAACVTSGMGYVIQPNIRPANKDSALQPTLPPVPPPQQIAAKYGFKPEANGDEHKVVVNRSPEARYFGMAKSPEQTHNPEKGLEDTKPVPEYLKAPYIAISKRQFGGMMGGVSPPGAYKRDDEADNGQTGDVGKRQMGIVLGHLVHGPYKRDNIDEQSQTSDMGKRQFGGMMGGVSPPGAYKRDNEDDQN